MAAELRVATSDLRRVSPGGGVCAHHPSGVPDCCPRGMGVSGPVGAAAWHACALPDEEDGGLADWAPRRGCCREVGVESVAGEFTPYAFCCGLSNRVLTKTSGNGQRQGILGSAKVSSDGRVVDILLP